MTWSSYARGGKIEWVWTGVDQNPHILNDGAAKSAMLARMLEVRRDTADALHLELPTRTTTRVVQWA